MQIKQNALNQQLQKKIAPLYLLIGQDTFLLNEAFSLIKSTIKQRHDCDERMMSLQNTEDWQQMNMEANSYSLFSDCALITAVYDKTSLPAAEKNALMSYLAAINPRSFLVLRAPNLNAKQVQSIAAHEEAMVVVAQTLTEDAAKAWIAKQLQNQGFRFETGVPQSIHQYTQGNMLACAQLIEKISLTYDANSMISLEQVLEQAANQCDHSPFELIDACLDGQAEKAIQILRHALADKTEATLMLWMLTQEVRLVLQLITAKPNEFNSVCTGLKIWAQRIPRYKMSLKRHQVSQLQNMLRYCQLIDTRIKSSMNTQAWNALENLAIALCLGQLNVDMKGIWA